jgi:hypothetical protein
VNRPGTCVYAVAVPAPSQYRRVFDIDVPGGYFGQVDTRLVLQEGPEGAPESIPVIFKRFPDPRTLGVVKTNHLPGCTSVRVRRDGAPLPADTDCTAGKVMAPFPCGQTTHTIEFHIVLTSAA